MGDSPMHNRYSRSPSPSPVQRDNGTSLDALNPGNNLYVAGLSVRVKEKDLEDLFSQEGKVIECRLVVDPRTRESRGFGFVTMETLEDAERCIKYLNRSTFEGRIITVEKAKRKRARTPTPGEFLVYELPIEGREAIEESMIEMLTAHEDHPNIHHTAMVGKDVKDLLTIHHIEVRLAIGVNIHPVIHHTEMVGIDTKGLLAIHRIMVSLLTSVNILFLRLLNILPIEGDNGKFFFWICWDRVWALQICTFKLVVHVQCFGQRQGICFLSSASNLYLVSATHPTSWELLLLFCGRVMLSIS